MNAEPTRTQLNLSEARAIERAVRHHQPTPVRRLAALFDIAVLGAIWRRAAEEGEDPT